MWQNYSDFQSKNDQNFQQYQYSYQKGVLKLGKGDFLPLTPFCKLCASPDNHLERGDGIKWCNRCHICSQNCIQYLECDVCKQPANTLGK